jgi:hypothetical protein
MSAEATEKQIAFARERGILITPGMPRSDATSLIRAYLHTRSARSRATSWRNRSLWNELQTRCARAERSLSTFLRRAASTTTEPPALSRAG